MDEMLPEALKCNISYKEFFHMTPSEIYKTEKAFWENKKQEHELMEQSAWLNGYYVLAAIGTAFSKKHAEYPENPAKERELRRTDFTEEEKNKYVGILFGQLEAMQKAFESNHPKDR